MPWQRGEDRERERERSERKGVAVAVARAESYRVNCKYFPRGTATSIQIDPVTSQVPRHPHPMQEGLRVPGMIPEPLFPFSCSPGSFHSSPVVKILGFPRGLVRSHRSLSLFALLFSFFDNWSTIPPHSRVALIFLTSFELTGQISTRSVPRFLSVPTFFFTRIVYRKTMAIF